MGSTGIDRLWERAIAVAGAAARGGNFPAELLAGYDGELVIPVHAQRPTVIANFVSTLDGVVAFDTDESSGGAEVSGFFDPDRFVMGLLRTMADAVLVGSGSESRPPNRRRSWPRPAAGSTRAIPGCPRRTCR